MYNRPQIGEILVRQGALESDELEAALRAQQMSEQHPRPRLGVVLLERESIDETQLVNALGAQFGLETRGEFDVEEVDFDLSQNLPYRFASAHQVMPFQRQYGMVLTALGDPLNTEALDLVRAQVGAEPIPILAPTSVIRDLIAAVYDRRGDIDQLVGELDDSDAPGNLDDTVEKIDDLLSGSGDEEGPIIQLVNTVFQQAMRDEASDIHIEPMEEYVLVRFRIDGVLKEVVRAPKRFQNSIIVRIKIMSNLNIAEKRIPQDGRIRFRIAGRDIDVRVATAPSTHGERVTMRLLDSTSSLIALSDMGLTEKNYRTLTSAIKQPHGILLVTGPTGSGKTTTLYSCLAQINTPEKNILTVEDPVENQLPGISQMQVNPKIDLTFASGLRSYLRHDPDIIMVGEIRDIETAEIAIQAALTGHLVFSTIHTNDAAGAFSRLIDMGVEPFLVSSSLTLALAQRLIRRLCNNCKEPYVPSAADLAEIGLTPDELHAHGGQLYRPVGCSECRGNGYRGRAAIYEMLPVNDAVRQLVISRADASTIKREAIRGGMRTMRQDGANKVLQGSTSIAEVLRVTQDETVG